MAYRGKILNVRVDTVSLGRGGQGIREVVEHCECVCIVPLDDAENVIMVKQYRKAVEANLLEIPAGGVENGEVSREAVLRELQEETGYTAVNLELLSSFWTTPGFCDELMHAYVATGLTPSSLPPDDDEDIQVERVPLSQVPDLIRKGTIMDAKSIASLLMVMHLWGGR
jgi:ADP-ribose pyrophosphatase